MRATVIGTADVPRLSVFRSNKHVVAQLIDDAKGVTIASAQDTAKKGAKKEKETLMTRAARVGEGIAKAAQEKKITKVVFDRGGYRYHGIVQALADGARKGGLKF